MSYLLRNLCRQETKDALRQIAQSTSYDARIQSNIGLDILGAPAVKIGDLKPTNYRVLVNGVPLANKTLMTELCFDPSWCSPDTTDTDMNGRINRDLNDIVNRASAINDKVLQMKNWRYDFSSLPYVKNVDDAILVYGTELPRNFEEINYVSIDTSPLILNFRANQSLDRYKGSTVEIQLAYENAKIRGRGLLHIDHGLKAPFDEKITLKSVMCGKYDIRISIPGSLTWEQHGIEVGEKPKELTVDLQPGADLKFEIVSPGGPQRDQDVFFYLQPNGRIRTGFTYVSDPTYYNFEWHNALDSCSNFISKDHRCIGLAPGEYGPIILSSEEKKLKQPERYKEAFSERPGYRGETRTIVIEDRSACTIDLETIELQPVQ
jgi:hypothetical protein